MNGLATVPRKPLPPFGAQIDTTADMVFCYCGEKAWRLAAPSADRVASLVFPVGRDPSEYRWPVNGLSVLVFALDQPRSAVDLLIVELLRARAAVVYVDLGSGDVLAYENPRGAVCVP